MIMTTRLLSGMLATTVLACCAMTVVLAETALPSPTEAAMVATAANTVSRDAQGRPIVLARMIVSATALD